jgi:hypothetical protein
MTRENYFVAREVACHENRVRSLSSMKSEALRISDREERVEKLAQIGVFGRVEADIFPRRIPIARKLDRLYERVHKAHLEGKHTPGWEDERDTLLSQRDRFSICNVAHPDMERMLKEERTKLGAVA